MEERASGLILRTRPLTETSLIVHWLTPELGRLATVAKGARRPKSPFRGKLDQFFLADFSFARSRRSELHTLRELVLRNTHTGLREDLGRLHHAAYAAQLIEQTAEVETPVPGIYELFAEFIARVEKEPAQPRNVFAFELKLLNELGLQPDIAQTSLAPGTRIVVKKMMTEEWPSLATLKLSPTQTQEICNFLHGFLIYHLDRMPAGRNKALAAC